MHIDILGTPYNIKFQTSEENPKFKTLDANGLAELYSKELCIRTGWEDEPGTVANPIEFREKVLRHELLHAIFHESGMSKYCDDEDLIDFLAIQYPKIEAIIHKGHEIHQEVINHKKGE